MPRFSPRPRLARVAIAAVAATAAAALPAAAQAATPAAGCPAAPLSHPFAPWSDNAPYELAPDGGLEAGGVSWALAGGAAAVEGNESFQVGGATDHRSLSLPAGSKATTAAMCIGVEHKTMRFFVRRSDAGRGSLKVEALYNDRSGRATAVALGTVDGAGSWAPTPILPMIVNELAPARGNALQVAFRFTPKGGNWSIDDVFVDPLRII